MMLEAHAGSAASKTTANEVVLEASALALPGSVAAFFYAASATPVQREAVTDAHRSFLNRFHRDHSATPLLLYDRDRGAAPFREVSLGGYPTIVASDEITRDAPR